MNADLEIDEKEGMLQSQGMGSKYLLRRLEN